MARDLASAICGMPLELHLHHWVVEERRKDDSRCSTCKRRGDFTDPPEWTPEQIAKASTPARLSTTTEARMDELLLEAKAALVKRLIGATEL